MPACLRSVGTYFSVPSAELRAALLLAWLALSAVLGVAAVAALAAPEQAVLAAAARCETPGGHRDACALCGMTHAFLAIRQGDLHGARETNAASLVVYPLFAMNETLMAFVWIRRRKRGWHEVVRPAAVVRNLDCSSG